MQSRRDQVQAHAFVMGRITSGMLRADPDAPESPQGRTNRGAGIGVVIAAVLCAGAFVLGLISPGTSSSWRSGQSLIIDGTTGTRYLYLGGRLRPVRNYASALLLGGATLTSTTVGDASLGGTPHGQPVGISGAPDALPGADTLNSGAWQVCARTAPVSTVLVVGGSVPETALTGAQALLAVGPDSNEYLVWRGSRLRLDQQGAAATALGYGTGTPVPVPAPFLDALPAGPDLRAPDTPGIGQSGPLLDGRATRIGQVFQIGVIGSAPQYYELRQEGLSLVTATVADLLLGDPQVRRSAYPGGTAGMAVLGPDVLAGHLAPAADRSSGLGTRPDRPDSPPQLLTAGPGQSSCVRIEPSSAGPRVSVALADDASPGTVAQPMPGALGACVPVDRIAVPPGGGALVQALGMDGDTIGATTYLVTDTGMKYLVSGADALKALGYSATGVERLPSSLLAMLPTGPDLSTAAATSGTAAATTPTCGVGGKTTTS